MKEPGAKAFVVCLMAAAGLLLFGTLTKSHGWGGDFAAYIMQARGVVDGTSRAFVDSNRFTVQQSSHIVGPVAYPWGFPVLLAPLYAVFGMNIMALKLVGVLCFLLFLLLLWAGFRRYHSRSWLVLLVGLFSLNPALLAFTNYVLSDMPFLLLSTSSVLLMGILIVDGRRLSGSRVWDRVILGVSITGAFLIRSNGILLLATLGVTQFIGLSQTMVGNRTVGVATGQSTRSLRRWIPCHRFSLGDLCVGVLPYAVFMGSVLAWRSIFPAGGATYLSLTENISLELARHHLSYYLVLPAQFFASVPHHYLLYGASIPLAIGGVLRRYQSDYHVLVYVALTFLLYILWPRTDGFRFILPVIPFFCSFVLTGLAGVQGGTTTAERTIRRFACLLPVLFVLGCFGTHSLRNVRDNLAHGRESTEGPFTADAGNMFRFIEQNTKPGSTVVFFNPRVMTMMSGRRSLMINSEEELVRGDYLCLYLKEGSSYQVDLDAVGRLSERGAAKLIYENSDFRVYRLVWGQESS